MEPLHPSIVTRNLYCVLKAAELTTVTFHDLRHSATSVMPAQGVHPAVAAGILGHANISTTLDIYTHVLGTALVEAMALVDAAS